MAASASVLSQTPADGLRVLRLTDGSIVKLFRRDKRLSTSSLRPYATRFCRNAARLRERGFPCVEVIDAWRVEGLARDAVHYRGLQGETLRDRLEAAADDRATHAALIIAYAALMARLHAAGVYFRAIHLGNVFVLPDGRLGLIDVTDVRFHRRALSITRRARNFKPPFRYDSDRADIKRFGVRRFVERYLEYADLTSIGVLSLLRSLGRQHRDLYHAIEGLAEVPNVKARP